MPSFRSSLHDLRRSHAALEYRLLAQMAQTAQTAQMARATGFLPQAARASKASWLIVKRHWQLGSQARSTVPPLPSQACCLEVDWASEQALRVASACRPSSVQDSKALSGCSDGVVKHWCLKVRGFGCLTDVLNCNRVLRFALPVSQFPLRPSAALGYFTPAAAPAAQSVTVGLSVYERVS